MTSAQPTQLPTTRDRIFCNGTTRTHPGMTDRTLTGPDSVEPSAAVQVLPSGRVSGRAGDVAVFVREFARDPLRTASLIPSSRALARAMVAPLSGPAAPRGRAPVVLELGPGTGVFTREVFAARPDARYVALELNPVMVERLTGTFPGLDVACAPAQDLGQVLTDRGLDAVDLVISGLPWQAWAGDTGSRLAGTVAGALAPAGAFTQFTYAWTLWAAPAHRQRAQLQQAFTHVTRSRPVWRNTPPAVVYTATNAPTDPTAGDRGEGGPR